MDYTDVGPFIGELPLLKKPLHQPDGREGGSDGRGVSEGREGVPEEREGVASAMYAEAGGGEVRWEEETAVQTVVGMRFRYSRSRKYNKIGIMNCGKLNIERLLCWIGSILCFVLVGEGYKEKVYNLKD